MSSRLGSRSAGRGAARAALPGPSSSTAVTLVLAVVTATLAVLGTLVFLLTGFSSALVCVPAGCTSSPTSTSCALDWTFQSGLCRAEAQSLPAANFHYLLLSLGLLLVAVLTVPIYWGTNVTKVI